MIEEDLNETEYSGPSGPSSILHESHKKINSPENKEFNIPDLVDLWMKNTEELFRRNLDTYKHFELIKGFYVEIFNEILEGKNKVELNSMIQKVHHPLKITD